MAAFDLKEKVSNGHGQDEIGHAFRKFSSLSELMRLVSDLRLFSTGDLRDISSSFKPENQNRKAP
jgi:hypothetical protein